MADTETDSRNAAISKKRAADSDDSADEVASKRPKSSDGPSAFAGWNRGVKASIRPTLGRPRLGLGKPAVVPSAADKLEAAGQAVERSASPSLQFSPEHPPSAHEKARVAQQSVVEPHAQTAENSSSEEGEIQSAFSGDDEAVMINVAGGAEPVHESGDEEISGASNDDGDEEGEVQSDGESGEGHTNASDLESGEISEEGGVPLPGLDGAADSESEASEEGEQTSNTNPSRPSAKDFPEPEVINLDDDDGSMMQGRSKPPPIAHEGTMDINAPPPAMITLADLDLDELRLQLRYYHIGQDPAKIPLTEPVRCLACAAIGHAARNCPELLCRHCRKYNEHFSEDCPELVYCNKCGKSGHGSQVCPSKLQPAEEDLVCEICGCGHHNSQDCESHWRTSRFPPFNPVAGSGARLYCYECGDAGHLGNDCRIRLPGKGYGSSMWSVKTMPGGVVPASALGHGRGPIPLSNTQRRRKDREQRQKGQGDSTPAAPLVRKEKAEKPKNTKIKFETGIAKNRSDLVPQQHALPPRPPPPPAASKQAGPPPAAAPPPPPPKNKNKKPKKARKAKKAAGGGKAIKAMPSAAKKAFIKGKS